VRPHTSTKKKKAGPARNRPKKIRKKGFKQPPQSK
jgi:hypothetical protein